METSGIDLERQEAVCGDSNEEGVARSDEEGVARPEFAIKIEMETSGIDLERQEAVCGDTDEEGVARSDEEGVARSDEEGVARPEFDRNIEMETSGIDLERQEAVCGDSDEEGVACSDEEGVARSDEEGVARPEFARKIEMETSGIDLERQEAVCGDSDEEGVARSDEEGVARSDEEGVARSDEGGVARSDEEGVARPRSVGEVVDVNEGQDDPHIQELEKKLLEQVVYSEEEAYMSYCDYATAMGFNVRRGKQYYFMGTKRVRSKTYCCSKEGVKDDKADINGIGYKKPETRTGCRAMISFVCDDNGQWNVSRFVKEHNHDMAPPYAKPPVKSGQAILAANVYGSGNALESLSEHDKIRELSLQLAIAKNRAETSEKLAATYKRQLHLIVGHIEEHNQFLSKKIQKVLNNVNDLASKDQSKS